MLTQRLRRGFKAFCEKTSLHGFLEFYQSDSNFWKLTWLSVIAVAIGFTFFHLYTSIKQYLNQATLTSIQIATEDDIIYPPLKYCISHWMFWLNIFNNPNVALSLESWLLAISRLTNVYYDGDSPHPFNIKEAEANLTRYFKERQADTTSYDGNVYTFQTFFIENSHFLTTEPDNLFINKEMLVLNNIVYMCFSINETQISTLLSPSRQLSFKRTEYGLAPFHLFPVNKSQLYNWFDNWCRTMNYYCCSDPEIIPMIYNDNVTIEEFMDFLSENRPPNILIVDGYNNRYFTLSWQVSSFWVDLKSSVQKWLPGGSKKCKPGVKSLVLKESCTEKCAASVRMDKYYYHENQSLSVDCINLATLILTDKKISDIKMICKNPIINYNDDYFPSVDEPEQNFDNTLFQQCLTKCSEGCNKFKWEMFVSVTSFAPPSKTNRRLSFEVTIQYPSPENVLVIQEMESKTWDDFVGNVGGLLGIWTGASILSLFQLVYLLCCTPDENTVRNITK